MKAGCTTRETMKTKIGSMGEGTSGEEETRSYLFHVFEMSWPRVTTSFEKCTTGLLDSALFWSHLECHKSNTIMLKDKISFWKPS